MNSEEIERILRDWIDDIVVKLGLCPFAAPVLQEEGLRIQVTTTRDEEEAMSLVLAEVSALVESGDEHLTSMIVTPNLFENFGAYLDIVEELEAVLEEVGADHLVQIASFHPRYCFEGVPRDDRANFTNRTPFPVFHLLRQEDVEEALDGWREPLKIPERNIKVLREMSQEQWNELFGDRKRGG